MALFFSSILQSVSKFSHITLTVLITLEQGPSKDALENSWIYKVAININCHCKIFSLKIGKIQAADKYEILYSVVEFQQLNWRMPDILYFKKFWILLCRHVYDQL